MNSGSEEVEGRKKRGRSDEENKRMGVLNRRREKVKSKEKNSVFRNRSK